MYDIGEQLTNVANIFAQLDTLQMIFATNVSNDYFEYVNYTDINDFVSNIDNNSNRSVSVCIDTSALHEYPCTKTHNAHKCSKLLIKRPQTIMFSNYV